MRPSRAPLGHPEQGVRTFHKAKFQTFINYHLRIHSLISHKYPLRYGLSFSPA